MSVTLDDDDHIPGVGADGRPDPAYAAALGLIPAPFGRRSAAFVIDAAIYVILLLPVFIGALPRWLELFAEVPDVSRWFGKPEFTASLIWYAVGHGLVIVFTVVQLILHGSRGVTIGKKALGIRSVNVATFGRPRWWIVLRALVLSVAFTVIPYLGAVPFLISPLWDPERRGRGWLDRIGRNWFIDVRRGLDPFDTKALRHARRALTPATVVEGPALPSLATGAAWGEPSFVPAARSSSGVVSHAPVADAGPAWEPPPIGVAPSEPRPAPVTPPVSQGATGSSPRRTAAEFVFASGLILEVRGTGLLGRNPEPVPGEVVEHLYRIDDPARQLSKTHLAFGIDESGVWIEDRGSSNGTFVTIESGAVLTLEPRKRTRITPGHVVEIGDTTFTVRIAQ